MYVKWVEVLGGLITKTSRGSSALFLGLFNTLSFTIIVTLYKCDKNHRFVKIILSFQIRSLSVVVYCNN